MFYASKRLQNDKEMALAAMANGHMYELEDASEELKNDNDFMRTAAKSLKEAMLARVADVGGYEALECASEEHKNNKDVVLAAVTQNGCALHLASRRLRDDKDVATAAVENDPGFDCSPLQSASKRLRDDMNVALAAVANGSKSYTHNYVMTHVSERLRRDRDFMISAVALHDEAALEHVSDETLKACPKLQHLDLTSAIAST